MSYFDPKVYNDEALNEEEKKLIAVYDFAIEEASNKGFIIDEMLGLGSEEDDSTLDRIAREIAEETIDAVIEYMKSQRLMLIVSWLDNRDED